jgi:hypothetical protein
MLGALIKIYRNIVAYMRRPYTRHKLAYGAMASLYLAACLGLEKAVVYGLLAAVYVVLALEIH